MVVCVEQGADLHMVQLMPLPRIVFCSLYLNNSAALDFLYYSSHSPKTTANWWQLEC